jgi:hypothetical protein
MSESINTNESTKKFMVLDRISKRIEYADRGLGIMKINNSDIESLKAGSYFRYRFLPNKRGVFMRRGVSADSFAFNASIAVKGETLRFDS